MESSRKLRDQIITEWFFEDWIGHKSRMPTSEDLFSFMKTLLDVSSADGKVGEKERQYIVGRAAIVGASQDILDKIQDYQPEPFKDVTKIVENINSSILSMSGTSLIYNMFRSAGADGLHPKELDAIQNVSKAIGISIEDVKKIEDLWIEEIKLREKRAALLFPKGFDAVLEAYKESRNETK